MKKLLLSLAGGVLFGAGLALSGMSDPGRVIRFLDPFDDWDPTLLFVMGGALLITPGFLTDGIGFLMLLPQSRGAMARYLVSKGLTQGMAGACRAAMCSPTISAS